MTRPRSRRMAALGALAAAGVVLAGCSDDGGGGGGSATDVDSDAPVTISVGGMPTTEFPEQRAAFERTLVDFAEQHENITIEPQETQWEADTFQALLAGGTMPTVLQVPFTEIGALIERQQVAAIGDYLADSAVLDQLNPTVMDVVTDDGGEIWGIPTAAYTMGILYNRALFTEAGLDPDAPPSTWEEVREAAVAIDSGTGAQGFQTMTLDNTGGWILTTMSYAFGSTLQSEDGTTATVDNPATAAALEYYRQLRWEDEVMGSNFLLNYDDAVNAFAAGQVGMFVQGADNYTNMVINRGMDPQDFGVAPLPLADDGLGTLGGGTIAVVDPRASAEQIAAAVAWIEFQSFRQFTDEEVAVEQAQAAAADGVAVGAPGLPVVNAELEAQYMGWIAQEINVPRENYEAYLSTVEEIPLIPEPAARAQETYATLDPVVQAVLTRQDADIAQLLQDAQGTVQAALGSG